MQPMEQVDPQQIARQAQAWREPLVELARELVRTPSPTGAEGDLARLLVERLRALGYDEAFTDEFGNVVGRVRGRGTGPAVLFTVNLDAAPVGDAADWATDPHAGVIDDGCLHGRGAADHKGALAAMAYGGAILKELGGAPAGDYIFAGVVQSHALAGLGMRYLVDKTLPEQGWHYDLTVLGNPTNLDLYLGHRGRVELEVDTIGRTAHAGAPWLGINAVYKMMPVLKGIQDLATALPSHPFLERSTITVTRVETAPDSHFAVPDRCTLVLDRRLLPSESSDDAVWQIQSVLNRLAATDPELRGEVRVSQAERTSYTGLAQSAAKLLHGFSTESGHALVVAAASALEEVGQSPRFGKWSYVTDGGYTAAIKKIHTVGYGPGDEKLAQTPFDRVKLDQLVQASAGYAAICQKVAH